MTEARADAVGCVLAGGLARRMGGGDKPLKSIAGRPMLVHVVDRLKPQVGAMVLNANGDPDRFAAFGLPVAADPVEGFAGPLAGVLAGLDWARRNAPKARFVATVAGDTPFFPEDLVSRLYAAAADHAAKIVLARSATGLHPVFGLWSTALADDLEHYLVTEESRKVLAFVDRHPHHAVSFGNVESAEPAADPFFNVNTPEELAAAEQRFREIHR